MPPQLRRSTQPLGGTLDPLPNPYEITIASKGSYFLWVLAFCLGIRAATSGVRAYRASRSPRNKDVAFRSAFSHYMRGLDPEVLTSIRGAKRADYGEYGASFLLGFFELTMFPILFFLGLHLYIAGWVTLKIAAIYFRWKSDRVLFNLFLFGNAATISASWWLSSKVEWV